jgi:hypothetical protein
MFSKNAKAPDKHQLMVGLDISFFKCKFVRKCWQLMKLEYMRLKLVDSKTASEVTNCILSMEENRKYETIILM